MEYFRKGISIVILNSLFIVQVVYVDVYRHKTGVEYGDGVST